MIKSLLFLLLGTLSYTISTTNPTQVHIALAGLDDNNNPNSMTVSWQTETNTITSEVLFGLESGNYNYKAIGTSSACKLCF